MKKPIHTKILVISIISAIIAYLCGENLLLYTENKISNIVRFSTYIVLFMTILHMSVFLLVGDLKNKPASSGRALKRIVVFFACFLSFMCIAAIVQFLYSLDIQTQSYEKAENYCFLIDNSSSTVQTDPDRERFQAILNILGTLDENNEVTIIVFDQEAVVVVEKQVVNQNLITTVRDKLQMFNPDGGTDIERALVKTLDSYIGTKQKTAAILLSDGESSIQCKKVIRLFKEQNIRIDAVAFSNMGFEGTRNLKKLANGTGGTFYSVENINQVQGALEKVMTTKNTRFLLGVDTSEGAWYISLFRVLAYTLIGYWECITLGLIFDNRYVYLGLRWTCILTGVLAGLAQELICKYCYTDNIARFIMCIFLALLIWRGLEEAEQQEILKAKRDTKAYTKISTDNNPSSLYSYLERGTRDVNQ